jgi:HAD superfamily phosphatase (TIGR01668 family)
VGLTEYLLPDRRYDSITDIDPDELEEYRGLIIDLDMTLTDYHQEDIDPEVRDWYDEITDRYDVCVLSNDASVDDHDRADRIEDSLGTTVVRSTASKPSGAAFAAALEDLGTGNDETAVIGDTPLTDILGGNRYGLDTIQVEPRDSEEPLDVRIGRFLGEQLQALADGIRQL